MGKRMEDSKLGPSELGFYLAHVVIVGTITLMSFIECVRVFWIRRGGGEERRFRLECLKIAWLLFLFYGLLDTAARILTFHAIVTVEVPYSLSQRIAQASDQLSNASEFVGGVGSIFIFYTIRRLGARILRVPAAVGAISPGAVFGWIYLVAYILITIVCAVDLIGNIFLILDLYDPDYKFTADGVNMAAIMFRVHVAMLILLVVLAISSSVWSTAVLAETMMRPKDEQRMKQPAGFLMVGSFLWLCACAYRLGEFADSFDITTTQRRAIRPYLVMTDAIFNFLPILVALGTLTKLARVLERLDTVTSPLEQSQTGGRSVSTSGHQSPEPRRPHPQQSAPVYFQNQPLQQQQRQFHFPQPAAVQPTGSFYSPTLPSRSASTTPSPTTQ